MEEKFLHSAAKKGAIASRESDAPRFDLPRACRLVQRSEYDAVYREGRKRAGREFTAFLRPNGLAFSRFGWSIKKALGGAVRRNRIRRRLREIFRLNRQEIAPGWDIVIHPRSSAERAGFSILTRELLKLLPRAQAPEAGSKQKE